MIPPDSMTGKIVSLCDMHGVASGTESALGPFLTALDENKPFAMDFWALVAKHGDGADARSANRPMLDTIVEGVTGLSVAALSGRGAEQARQVAQLGSLLAGEDIHRPVTAPADAGPAERPFDKAPPAAAGTAPGIRFRAPQGPGDPPRSRLILEPVPLPGREAPPLASREQEAVRKEKIALGASIQGLFGAAAQRPVQENSPTAADDPTIRLPLSEYGADERDGNRRKILLTVGVAVALGVAVLVAGTYDSGLWQRFGLAMRAGYGAASAAMKGDGRSAKGGAPGADAAEMNTDAKGGQAGSGRTGAANGAGPVSRVAGERRSAPVTESAEDFGPNAAKQGSADAGEEDSYRRKVVFPGEMEDYLQSSRVPVYPEAARANGVEGRVVMQAVITEDGTVGHLHVTEGDPALRTAATDAVSKWRYRPYLVDGKPVVVTTTVTVNFKLNQ